MFDFKTSRGRCASGGTNRVEHHGGIGEIRDVFGRVAEKTVPGLLRGIVPLGGLGRKGKADESAAVE